MKPEKVKQFIKKKFGTMSRFCRLAGYDRYELQKVLSLKNSGMELAKIYDKAVKTKDTFGGNEITDELRNGLTEAINKKFGSVLAFCEAYPQFKAATIYQILDGKRKNITGIVQRMMEILNVKS